MIPMNSAMAGPLVPWFIRLRVPANAITMLSLLSGVAAGWLLSHAASDAVLLGSALFLLSNLLDECDGKVARQTNTCSRLGAFLDTITDCMVHVAFFAGLGAGMSRLSHGPWLALGWIAAGGSILSFVLDVGGITPWQPPSQEKASHPSLAWVAEWFRIDFSLLVLLSAACGSMGWILWAGALGVFLFWIPSTFLIAVQTKTKGSRA